MKLMTMNKLHDFHLSWIFFTTDREVKRSGELHPYQYWMEPTQFNWQNIVEDANESHLDGKVGEDIDAQLDWTLAHDTHLTRFSLNLLESGTKSPWQKLQSCLDEGIHSAASHIPQP